MKASSTLALIFSFALGCGGAKPVAQLAPPPSAPPVAAPSAPVASAPAPAPSEDEDDPNESADPIAMTPEITRPWDKASFPPRSPTPGDEEKCWQSVQISGHPQQDFDALIASCGAPMGLREYASPTHGHLHSVKDKRDTFSIQLYKGLCYRYFAVGDSGIKDIDILVEKKGAVLVGDDKQTGPVAILDAGKPWCMTQDAEYFFNIEVHGEGKGKYVFGVWARPK